MREIHHPSSVFISPSTLVYRLVSLVVHWPIVGTTAPKNQVPGDSIIISHNIPVVGKHGLKMLHTSNYQDIAPEMADAAPMAQSFFVVEKSGLKSPIIPIPPQSFHHDRDSHRVADRRFSYRPASNILLIGMNYRLFPRTYDTGRIKAEVRSR